MFVYITERVLHCKFNVVMLDFNSPETVEHPRHQKNCESIVYVTTPVQECKLGRTLIKLSCLFDRQENISKD